MFELKSPAGNVHRIVATEQERERLLAEGYVDVTPEQGAPAKSTNEGKGGKNAKTADEE